MHKPKAAKFLLIIAAMLFIVKPFLGFRIAKETLQTKQAATILVKIFSKRKPEFLEDANEKKTFVGQQLSKPPLKLLVCIQSLLALFFLNWVSNRRHINSFLRQLAFKLMPDERTYLLTGKLTI